MHGLAEERCQPQAPGRQGNGRCRSRPGLHVSPLRHGPADFGGRPVAAFVLLVDPANARIYPTPKAALLGLSRSEGRVAALLAGTRLRFRSLSVRNACSAPATHPGRRRHGVLPVTSVTPSSTNQKPRTDRASKRKSSSTPFKQKASCCRQLHGAVRFHVVASVPCLESHCRRASPSRKWPSACLVHRCDS